MKKVFLLALLFVSTFAIGAEAISSHDSAPAEQSFNQTTMQITDSVMQDIKITEQKIHETNKDLSYVIGATYPQIKGSTLSSAAQSFNQAVAQLTQQQIEQFKKYVIADQPHMKTLPPEIRKNSLNIGYELNIMKVNNQMLASLRLAIEGYQAGRAHPYHKYDVLNFNLMTGKLITLDELFKPNSKYLTFISNFCRQKLGEKLQDKWMLNDGTKPIGKNFKIWNLDANGLRFTFEEYQVAPYVEGSQEVVIPFVELKDLLAPTAPFFACTTNPKQCGV